MPSPLASYLETLEVPSADITQNRDIVAGFGQVAEQVAAEDAAQARYARIEQEVLSASKSLENKVGFHFSGVQRDEEGNEYPFGWPDTSGYGDFEYAYLKDRFATTQNLYLKSEYGFFLYLRKQAGRPEEVADLVQTLAELSQHYFALEAAEDASQPYVLYAVQSLALAFRLAASRQRDAAVAAVLPALMARIMATQQRWDATRKGTPMLLGTFTGLVAEQLSLFQTAGHLTDFLNRNRALIEVLGASYRYGAMELARASADVARQARLGDARSWELLVAHYYEQLADEAADQGNSAAVSFVQQSLRLYKELGETAAVERLTHRYQELRSAFKLVAVTTEVPTEQLQAHTTQIAAQVARSSEEEIVRFLASTPMFASVESIRDYEKMRENALLDAFPIIVEDKHGNPVQVFTSEKEKRDYRLLDAYGMLGQFGTQTLVQLLLEAYRADKLHLAGVMDYLAGSWLGEPRPVREHGVEKLTHPLRLLESGIRIIFQELDRWRAGATDAPDFIAAIDSLTLKIEYILRYMCERLGIGTFRPKKSEVVHEKLLEEIFRDLESHLDPEDLFFIKFYLHEKAGQNLRNRVAHGLLDDGEYGIEKAFLVLSMLLKLASYEFQPRENALDEHEQATN